MHRFGAVRHSQFGGRASFFARCGGNYEPAFHEMDMDVLAIGAHPDDCELFMGGTLAKFADLGYEVAIVNLTRGECGSRGTPEIRRQEAEQAARILKIPKCIFLDLGDSRVGLDPSHRTEAVQLIRAERPSLVFTHAIENRHPDHDRANRLVHEACFVSYVAGFDTSQERFHPSAVIEFLGNPMGAIPNLSFIVPINGTFGRKMDSLRTYKSQFYDPQTTAPETWIASQGYFEQIESRARLWGSVIGENFAEAFYSESPSVISDAVAFFVRAGSKSVE